MDFLKIETMHRLSSCSGKRWCGESYVGRYEWGMLPEQIAEALSVVRKTLDIPLGIHAHNDSDLAVANTLAAVNAGVTLIQGTINGLGERCGNASLTSIIPILQLKMGILCFSEHALSHLTGLSRFVQELSNLNPRKDLPFVGQWAFRHKGGVHVSAMRKHPQSYQHIFPELVGNQSSSAVSELSGRANILEFCRLVISPLLRKW